MQMRSITPCLWFDDQAEQAANFYTGVFPNSRIVETSHYDDGAPLPAGTVLTVLFELDGTRFTALNGGPAPYRFNEAVSFQVACQSQDEVDHYWSVLGEGGKPGPCGWLKDRFGLSWQIVPTALPELLTQPDRAKAQRVLAAMMQMGKIDIAALEHAAGSV
jgi:predicted 3-demethylubiquinone-9 3-methyltransferase (glyoxalase superfamily)